MLKQASVEQIRRQQLPRANTHIVIGMCYYPRGVKKEWSDEFRNDLAPDRGLFKEWKEFEKQSGHDEAFRLSRYEERFQLSPIALFRLKQFSIEGHGKDIYFVCQCKVGERCHREMLLLTAQERYGAAMEPVHHSYPVFEKRIAGLDDEIKLW